jgi:RimJ/RimL family protein N-acetyltransferase
MKYVFSILFLIFTFSAQASDQDVFTFKHVTGNDLSILHSWFQEPHVTQWWPVPQEHESFQQFTTRIRSVDTFGFIAFLGNEPIGYIQYYQIDQTHHKTGLGLPKLPENTVGIDQFIGNPQWLSKGYGTRLIKDFLIYLVTIKPETITVILDPEPINYAAIRCYEKVGFVSMGICTTFFGDCLLMSYDLLQLKNNS